MKTQAQRELLLYWLTETSDKGLEHVVSMLQQRSDLLIRGAFYNDRGGKCLASWFAHHHPSAIDGPDWLRIIGLTVGSHVIAQWDNNPFFPKELLRALKLELFYRKESTDDRPVQAGGGSSARPRRRLHADGRRRVPV